MLKNMSRLFLSTTFAIAISTLPTLSFAQVTNTQFPQPNQQNDYNSIQIPGTTSKHLVWKVVSSELNCRSQPGSSYRVVRTLYRGDNVDIVEKPKIYRDKQGKPWLYVAKEGSAEDIKIRCFVRANKQFIQPIPYSFS